MKGRLTGFGAVLVLLVSSGGFSSKSRKFLAGWKFLSEKKKFWLGS